MFDKGSNVVLYGSVLDEVVGSRKGQRCGPIMPDLSAAEWVAELEESIEHWNNGVRELDSMAFGSGDEMDIN